MAVKTDTMEGKTYRLYTMILLLVAPYDMPWDKTGVLFFRESIV